MSSREEDAAAFREAARELGRVLWVEVERVLLPVVEWLGRRLARR